MDSAERHLKAQSKEISREILALAAGIVFLTLVKGAFIWSASLATGIVVKRLSRTKWGFPVSVGMASAGIGAQAGIEKVDIIILLADEQEMETFVSSGQLKLGVSVCSRL